MVNNFLCETCKHKGNRCIPLPNGTCGAYENAMPYRADICNTCIHMNENCFTVEGKTCSNYKPALTVGNHLAKLLSFGKYKEAAEFLYKEADPLCVFSEKGEEFPCQYETNCSICWERFLNAKVKGETLESVNF